MRSMGAVLVWVAGCSASVAAPDTYVGPSDAGIDAPRVRRSDVGLDGDPDAPVDAPFPAIDCADPALWSRAPDVVRALSSIEAISNCYDDIPAFYFPMHVDAWGWGPGCVRVHASSRSDLPVGTYELPREGATLGLVSPIALDVEVRGWVPTEDRTGWRLLSERGRHAYEADPTFRLVTPPAIELGRDVVAAHDRAYLTSSELRSISTPTSSRSREGILAVGTQIGATTVITEGDPPTIAVLSHDLSPTSERPWPRTYDEAHTWILDFGVVSGSALVVPYGTPLEVYALPVVFDEMARASADRAFARAGDRGYVVTSEGAAIPGPTGVARVLAGGGFVDAEGRVMSPTGVWRALDPAIGDARALRGRGAIVEGERGLEYVPFGHHIGPTVRRFDPETEGRSTLPGPLDAIVLERADGVFVVHGEPRLEGFCE